MPIPAPNFPTAPRHEGGTGWVSGPLLHDITLATCSGIHCPWQGRCQDPVLQIWEGQLDVEAGDPGLKAGSGSSCRTWASLCPPIPWCVTPVSSEYQEMQSQPVGGSTAQGSLVCLLVHSHPEGSGRGPGLKEIRTELGPNRFVGRIKRASTIEPRDRVLAHTWHSVTVSLLVFFLKNKSKTI